MKTAFELISQTPQSLKRKQVLFHESITPFVRMKAEIINRSPFSLFVASKNAFPETVYPAETNALLAEIDQYIESVARRIYAE